jgi:DNA-binding HxlR family transcriptional regulator
MKTMEESKMSPPIFIGRWTPKILFSLRERSPRYGELRRHLGSVSQRMLTRTLRNLLTRLGRTIVAPLGGMCRWAKRYGTDVSADVYLPETYQTQ